MLVVFTLLLQKQSGKEMKTFGELIRDAMRFICIPDEDVIYPQQDESTLKGERKNE